MALFPNRWNNFIPNNYVAKYFFFCPFSHRNFHQNSSNRIVSLSNCYQIETHSSSEMEGQPNKLEMGISCSELGNYSEELGVAVRAVHMACLLCQIVQENLVSESKDQVSSKDDNFPVTIAGNFLFHVHLSTA